MTPAPRDLPSPNQDDRPAGTPVDVLLLHYTGMQSAQAAIDRLRDPAARVSSHYVVEEDGTVWRLVPEERRAWHAGISFWRGQSELNGRSVGIEIVNPGHEWGYRPFPAVQMAAVTALCRGILARWPIPAVNVVGHSDVAPDRKQDPGELFDWPGLAAAGIGLWPDEGPGSGPGVDEGPGSGPGVDEGPGSGPGVDEGPGSGPGVDERPGSGPGVDDVDRALRAIGYPVPDLATTVTAFQRRWRPGAVTGVADPGTRARMAAVLAAYEG